jgi:sigma-B regulation protein RsbU (phosphoserine phosphatase)
LSKLIKLRQVDKHANAIGFLKNILNSELGNSSLAMVNCLKLDKNHFQISNYCHDDYCPVYNAAEFLNPTNELRTYQGQFIEQWKRISAPFIVVKKDCSALFQDKLANHQHIIVVPILLDLHIERWILVIDHGNKFNVADLERLSLLANFAMVDLARAAENKELEEITNWREQELKEISRLQHLLLPEAGTKIPGIELAFRYQVYKEAGGDYFDISSLSDDKEKTDPHFFGAIIADVTGHGPSAAVEAAMLDAILRTYKRQNEEEEPPAAVLDYVNTHFFTRKNRGKFITVIAFTYDPQLRRLRYACAGHPHGYIKRGKTLIRLDQAQDIPIGVLKEYQWTNHDIQLQPHDIIFVYTDVVLETRSPEKEEFGFDRLETILANSDKCPHCVVDDVANGLTLFAETDVLFDDLTLCAIEICS